MKEDFDERLSNAMEELAQDINKRNVGKEYTTSSFPSNDGIWSNEELSDEEEIERAKKRQAYFYHSKNRTNMSKEADEIIKKLERGENISRKEEFMLVCDDPDKVEEWSKMDDLKQKARNGELSQEELKYLTDTVYGKDIKESKEIYDAMIKKGRVKQTEQKTEISSNSREKGEDNLVNAPTKKNEFIADLESKSYTKDEIARNDVANKTFDTPQVEQPIIQAPVNQGPELSI